MCCLHDGIDAVDQIFCTDSHHDGDYDQSNTSCPWTKDLFLFGLLLPVVGLILLWPDIDGIVLLPVLGAILLIKQIAMGFELEEKIENVEDQKNDGGGVGKD